MCVWNYELAYKSTSFIYKCSIWVLLNLCGCIHRVQQRSQVCCYSLRNVYFVCVVTFLQLQWPCSVWIKPGSAAPSVWSCSRIRSPSRVATATAWAAWRTAGTVGGSAAVPSAEPPSVLDPYWAETPCWQRWCRDLVLWSWVRVPLLRPCTTWAPSGPEGSSTPPSMCLQSVLRGLTGRWGDQQWLTFDSIQ